MSVLAVSTKIPLMIRNIAYLDRQRDATESVPVGILYQSRERSHAKRLTDIGILLVNPSKVIQRQ